MSEKSPAFESQVAHINEDKGPQTVAASIVLMVSTTTAVVLRLVAQRIVKPTFTADDYCALGALIIALALCADLIASFSSNNRKFSRPTAAIEDQNTAVNTVSRRWPGGRGLPSVEGSQTALSPDPGGRNIELGEWLDRRDVMEDQTTRSEPERHWLDTPLAGPATGELDLEMKGEMGLKLLKHTLSVKQKQERHASEVV
ncbi:MAG: hypothetical protein Q9207_006508 [Kuettlingeria erythrocarpa]